MDQRLTPKLTIREHRAVWMLSQGHTHEEIAAVFHILPSSASEILVRAREKFGYASRYAFLAAMILQGHVGLWLDCGKALAAYQRHIDKDEPVCPACRLFMQRRATPPAEDAPAPVEIQLRPREMEVLQAIASGADSMQEIGQVIKLGRRSVASLLSGLYAKLNIPHRDNHERRRILLYVARQRGLMPLPDGTYRKPGTAYWVPPQMRLSAKQITFLKACQDGASLTEVGARLGISREAASARLSEIYRRLGVPQNVRGNGARRDRRLLAYRRAEEFGLLN